MLDRARARLNSYLAALGRAFARVAPSPTAWTVVGFFLALLAGVAYCSPGYSRGFAAGVLILASGFFDIVDGSVARVVGKVSKRGAFLDSTLDRLAEVAVYFGLLVGGFSTGPLVLLALSLSLLVSYTRAKADSLGMSLSGVGIGERSERLLVLAFSSILGLTYWGVVFVAVTASFTFVERAYRASMALG
jgi:archaetidylinositol phosphate synthase